MKISVTILASSIIASALIARPATSAEWKREAGVTAGAYLSDNICLSDRDRKTRGAGTLTPDIHLRGRGSRARLSLKAAVEYNTLGDSDPDCNIGQGGRRGNRQSLIPSLRYKGDVDLINNWLTLESDAFVSRSPIDPFEAGSNDSLNGRDNTNIIYQYGAGPLIQRRFFDDTDLRLKYRYSEQYNDVSVLSDSSEDRIEFDLTRGRGVYRLITGISGRYSKVMYERSDLNPDFDNTLSSAEVRAALRVTSSWEINALAGEEWNEFTSARSEIDGSYWDAGLRWTPNERVEIAAGTGERFFGKTPHVQVRYRHKKSQITASYLRSLTFPRNLRVADDTGDIDDLAGGPDDIPLSGSPPFTPSIGVGGQPTFIGDTPVINERATVRYRYTGRRSTIMVTASDSRQERTVDRGEATFSDLQTSFTRALSSNLTTSLRFAWSEREGNGENVGIFGQRSQAWRAGIVFTRRLSSQTTVTAGYQYTRQKSDFSLNEYNENRLSVSVRHTF